MTPATSVDCVAFGSFSLLPSWLSLGATGRSLAIRGVRELEEASAGRCRVEALRCRGLIGPCDIAVMVEAADLDEAANHLEALAMITAGRHLRPLTGGCAVGGSGRVGDPWAALYLVRGKLVDSDPSGVETRRWDCRGLSDGDHLVLAGARSPGDLRRATDLAAEPMRILAVGRRGRLGDVLGALSPAVPEPS